ncbi:MAG: glycoside hydrolase family 16 protein [Glaciimonas sp.]|nr:glycoside hydrolase family 16 protein [Glaciimonas sp.]
MSENRYYAVQYAALLRPTVLVGLFCFLNAAHATQEIFFDDFNYVDKTALINGGWIIRDQRGHPGIEGAQWGSDSISLIDDVDNKDKRLLRLTARTDGTPQNTFQAQLCHQRKYLEGTYAARIRFSNAPVSGPNGDVVVQTFYTVSPLRFDLDPQYSEMDWEYLPNGGWGDVNSRLYSVTWQTVQMNPWQSYNQPHQRFGKLAGWHILMMQAAAGKTRFYLDGERLTEHGGRNYPVVPMSINFNLWFSPGGQLANTQVERVYQQDVAGVFHARNQVLSPKEVEAAVQAYSKSGKHQVDTVPESEPVLASTCDF